MLKHAQGEIGFVFIHGAGLNGQVWRKVIEGFEHPCLLVEFPLRRDSSHSRSRLSLEDYVAHMKRQVDEWETRKIIIVAHSIGGVLALRLASELADRLAGIVAVGAAIPKRRGSFLSILPIPQRLLLSVLLRTIGTKPPESALRTGLCSDLSPDQAAEIVNGFIPEAVRLYTDRIDTSVPDVPKLYVKLTDDKELRPSLQNKMIANLSPQYVRSLATGHLPMISNPAGLRSILEIFLSEAQQ
ncbi:pimeloyl-ACP methyl ester carboxylesterase [Paenibacillus phyllosphaerae]|uniref:Pimeloyl-ACP methyl ester carboxylesterase n=1 Tax=Paenibacillus phyllosphaerae TaxID=274593 RepID=A0A7W5B171_9BACL|nr:alpha/beta hydrolase [Paenibacillus phyllosphaerae]MBB3112463.1 pimeloyl-ACP methyl ester carboxylesterase [Paenibacillus phyllosphaerae]